MSTYTEAVTVVRSQLVDMDVLCHGIVVHEGEEDACCKSATSVIYDAQSAAVWPACSWHANRYGGALTIAQIRQALTTGAVGFEREVKEA